MGGERDCSGLATNQFPLSPNSFFLTSGGSGIFSELTVQAFHRGFLSRLALLDKA